MSKKRRYLICTAMLVACVGVVCIHVATMSQQPAKAKMDFDRIELGMMIGQAIAILGEPPMAPRRSPDDPVYLGWFCREDRATIWIQASKEGVITKMEFNEDIGLFPAKLRRWLHLPKAE